MSVERHDTDAIGNGTELARYRISSGERVLVGWRGHRGIEIIDCPASGRSRRHVVERGMTSMSDIRELVSDYVRQAKRYDTPPMSLDGIGAMLASTDTEALGSLFAEAG